MGFLESSSCNFLVLGKVPKVFEKLQQKSPATAVQNTLLRPVESEKSYEDSEYTWE